MKKINQEKIGEIVKNRILLGTMMNNHELEEMIITFVTILNQRTKNQGGKNR